MSSPARKNMAWVPGGKFLMGSEDFYPEERPARRVEVDGFWMDDHPVTVAEFRRFVTATVYVTMAERPLDPAQYPGADPDLLRPGSLVFFAASGPVDLRDVSQWWRYTPGADWRHPRGPGSTTGGLDRHPVTHVAAEDADAYAVPVAEPEAAGQARHVPGPELPSQRPRPVRHGRQRVGVDERLLRRAACWLCF